MKLADALSLLGLGTAQSIRLDDAKKAFQRAAMKYHPDRNPAGGETMKAINQAWAYLQELFQNSETLNNSACNDDGQAEDFGHELNEAINAVINLEGVLVEVCGAWVWLSGNTKPHKDAIKKAGFKWASKKMQWFFRPENYKCRNHTEEWSMEAIRDRHGSSTPPKNYRKSKELESPEVA